MEVAVEGQTVRSGIISECLDSRRCLVQLDGRVTLVEAEHISRISPAKAYQNYLHHVASLLDTSRGRELPTVVPNEVRARLIFDVTRQWRAPALAYLGRVHDLLASELSSLVEELAPDYLKLQGVLWRLTESLLAAQKLSAESKVCAILDSEDVPFTTNEHYLRDLNVREARKLERAAYPASAVAAKMREMGLDPKEFEKNQRVVDMVCKALKDDDSANDTADVLDLVAFVRSYVKVAYKRVADNVPMMVDLDLVRNFNKEIRARFVAELLGKSDAEKQSLLMEDTEIRAKRIEFLGKQRILKEAVTQLRPLCDTGRMHSRKRPRDAKNAVGSSENHKLFSEEKSLEHFPHNKRVCID